MFVPFGFSTRRRTAVPSLAGVSDLSREMDRVFAALSPAPRRKTTAFEDQEDKLVFTMSVPGFAHQDLELTLENGELSIRGERQAPLLEGYEARHRERSKLSFHQQYELPCRVETDKVVAKLEDGILRLELPKSGEEAARSIPIHSPENN